MQEEVILSLDLWLELPSSFVKTIDRERPYILIRSSLSQGCDDEIYLAVGHLSGAP